MTVRAFFNRLFTPRWVTIRVEIDALPHLGAFGAAIRKYLRATKGRSLFAPRIVISEQSIKPEPNDRIADGYELEPGEIWVPSLPAGDAAVDEPGVKRHVDPVAEPDEAAARCEDGSIGPSFGNAGDKGRSGNADERMPPIEILADSRNVHPATPPQSIGKDKEASS